LPKNDSWTSTCATPQAVTNSSSTNSIAVWLDDVSQFIEHIMMGHPSGLYCQRTFTSAEALEQHLRDSWCGYDFTCDVCDRSWRDEAQYNDHMTGHPMCEYCRRLFKNDSALEQHLRDSRCGYDFTCDVCDLSWREEAQYKDHMILGHPMSEYCQQLFNNDTTLQEHVRDSQCINDESIQKPGNLICLRPSQVHFSHDSISCRFSCGRRVRGTLDEIVCGQTCVRELPVMLVTQQHGKWWAFTGNRRLWVFQQLESMGRVERIWVKVTSRCLKRRQWTTTNGGTSAILRD